MKKYIILLLSIISIIYMYNITKEDYTIPKEAIRFRVIANSNTIYDQDIKTKVKDIVQNRILELIKDSKNIETTRKIIKTNEKELDKLVKKTLKELNYDKKYSINYGKNYFPTKKYKGKSYKEGNYESLVIKLGSGEGDNWWCVLFPPICLMDEEKAPKNDIEYTLFFKELLNKIGLSK